MFWDIFCELCKKNDKTPNAVTKALGLSTATATNWKTSGRTPNGDTLRSIADYFGVSVDYLLGRETQQVPVALSRPKGYDKLTDEERKFIDDMIEKYTKDR